jgi:hypothetical protein
VVDPDYFDTMVIEGFTQTLPLSITNTGVDDLLWNIFEESSDTLVDWFDNFDSYETGSQIHGQGGWKGWFNNPGAGAIVVDDVARSTPNSVDILGASDLVHEYSGYNSGTWIYTAWQYIPTGFTGQTYFIMLNNYNDQNNNLNWSTQVC